MVLPYVLLVQFLFNPYHEPLWWFMIGWFYFDESLPNLLPLLYGNKMECFNYEGAHDEWVAKHLKETGLHFNVITLYHFTTFISLNKFVIIAL